MCPASPSITNSRRSPKHMSTESVVPSNRLILRHPLLLLPSIFPSIRVFSNESALHIRWPKYWSFSFNISPSNEHPGLNSFRMDWLDLLAVQGTLKSLHQHIVGESMFPFLPLSLLSPSKDIYGSYIYKSPKLETRQMLTNKRMDKVWSSYVMKY